MTDFSNLLIPVCRFFTIKPIVEKNIKTKKAPERMPFLKTDCS